MIKYTPANERKLSLFRTSFEGGLDANNRWVRMAELVPWDKMAEVFYKSMSADKGRASIDLRVVLGALLVKHIEGISDEDTIQYIQENIYAQYFVGLPRFQPEPVFSSTLFVEIRKRLGKEGSQKLNDEILLQEQVEGYKALYGYYPELVLVDQIYLNRENRKYLKDRGIRHSGKPLGRPVEMSRQEKQRRKKEQNKRSEIEGKFGQGKSKYGLDDIQTRLEDTSYACIGLILRSTERSTELTPKSHAEVSRRSLTPKSGTQRNKVGWGSFCINFQPLPPLMETGGPLGK